MTRAFCSAAMRAGIGGCDANMAEMPPRPVMPEASKDLGRSPGSRPPRRARARIMGSRAPIRWAEPASARYSR
ncbi:hypothetical protein G6F23_016056 [Rhizopus arrhizus]|nr:hypothetical protein G6F23_016056 [Rhizopus arrhizus]